ncbi:hypothetical protein PLICRDRAFT_508513 [Plicaturopsis crispa FD-325 SS-3]|nr:hypothetical protein PLICRDRAFT_508513 [Plicaturopsis crispa FD-325 SS-3]
MRRPWTTCSRRLFIPGLLSIHAVSVVCTLPSHGNNHLAFLSVKTRCILEYHTRLSRLHCTNSILTFNIQEGGNTRAQLHIEPCGGLRHCWGIEATISRYT